MNKGYKKGLEDAWKCAKKIALNQYDGGIDVNVLSDIFGVGSSVSYKIFENFSVFEVKERIDEWEKKQEEKDDKLRVGDEIYVDAWGLYCIVTKIGKAERIEGICSDGACYSVIPKKGIKRTGRHFASDLSNLLSMIGEDENESQNV